MTKKELDAELAAVTEALAQLQRDLGALQVHQAKMLEGLSYHIARNYIGRF